MTWLERPDVDIGNKNGKSFANEIRELAKRLDIDLTQANDTETSKILKGLKSSLSEEIVTIREGTD